MIGRIHSLQSLGAVDGPGLRSVLFLQGCPLRCDYCHNPDTWEFSGGEETDSAQVVKRLLRYRDYWGARGGVTLSGGEPLMQPEFTADIFARLHQSGVHTALDTSGMATEEAALQVLPHTDLILLDVKFFDEEHYRAHCGGSFTRLQEFLALADARHIPVWLRHVVVPGWSDNPAGMQALAAFADAFSCVEKIELLPFRKLCIEKYHNLGIPFPLETCPEFPESRLEELYAMLKK